MNKIKFCLSTLSMVALSYFSPVSAQNFPLQVKNSKITYTQDAKGNRILDFSYCGYKASEQDIPSVNNAIFVSQREGDATDAIQRAIDYVSSLKPNKQGFRGAVLLDKGTFNLSKSLWIRTSGVVLRGSDKHETVLFRHGFDRSAVLHIEGINNRAFKDTFQLASSYVPVNRKNTGIIIGSRIKGR